MLQLELYVKDVQVTANLFSSIFDLRVIEEKPGWRHLRHPGNYDIMLFTPGVNVQGESHWSMPKDGTGGSGIEIVICTSDVPSKLLAVRDLGYTCSDLQFPPWGSVEFLFSLPEGYLIRVKQPLGFTTELDYSEAGR